MKQRQSLMIKTWMNRILIGLMLLGGIWAVPAVAQVDMPLCKGLVFSTEEDFLAQVSTPDGNPIISDGDLLSRNFPAPGVQVCARNHDLLRAFKIRVDLGLDAVDVVYPEKLLIAFSTELDDPQGRFTAGDLLTTTGAVIPNRVLMARFQLPESQDIGLDAIQFKGEEQVVIRFLEAIKNKTRTDWLEDPNQLFKLLEELDLDILISTEGTGFSPAEPSFLDGDLLSVKSGTIVIPNANFLLPLPAGLPARGVDYGLDAFTLGLDPIENVPVNLFSTELDSLDRPLIFTDGDILQQGGAVFWKNINLIQGLEPKVKDLGLDALDFVDKPTCQATLDITRVGGIYVSLIHPATGYAQKQDGFTPDPTIYDSPFGQWVSIRGNVPDVHCLDVTLYEYRLQYKEGAGPWIPIINDAAWQVKHPFGASCFFGPWVSYLSDGNGWISLSAYWQAKFCAPDQALNVWKTSGFDGQFRLRLALRKIGDPTSEIVSAEVPVVLDNTQPNDLLVQLYDAGGTQKLSNQCEVTGAPTGPTIITVKGRARDNGQGLPTDGDEHFRVYGLSWTGGDVHVFRSFPVAGPPDPAGYRFYDGGRPDLDGTGTLPPTATDVPLGHLNLTAEHNHWAGSDPPACGYTIRLRARDRAIRGSFNPALNVVSDYIALGWLTDYHQSFCFAPSES